MANKSRPTALFLAGMILFLLLIHPADLRPSPEDVAKGKAIFESMCAACHNIGGGVKVGPDLKGITNQRSTAWLTNFISDPNKVIKSGDPAAKSLAQQFHGLEMPTLGLSSEQAGNVMAYLRSTASPAKAQTPPPKAQAPVSQAPAPQAPALQPPAPPVTAVTGSAETGGNLFGGRVAFQKGGPACISCHDVARVSFPGGGTLGPDLTGAYAKFGSTAMSSILATLPFPTMRPIFDRRPLTVEEQGDLRAFFQNSGVQSLISRTLEIGLAGLGGLIILIILTWIVWQDRLVTVRKALVERAAKIRSTTGGTGK